MNDTKTVDRIEVIDETGRAYVRGSIYGTPVKVELSYQDDGRTLKVFVTGKGDI
jgi:ribosomal protein S28E/S33